MDLPTYASDGAAGLDLLATEQVVVLPAGWTLVPTGVKLALPEGFEAQIRPRSGLALEHGVTCLNTPGTIDSDYRGEIKVMLVNFGAGPYTVRRGDRIAQMVVAEVARIQWREADALPESARGAGGFGSTGV